MKRFIAIASLVLSTSACTVTFGEDTATAQPAANSNASPQPVPLADSAKIAAVCGRYGMASYQSDCMIKLRNARIDSEAIDACNRYGMASYAQECLEKVQNKWFAPGIVSLCGGYSMASYTEECMVDLADYAFDSYSINACSKYSMTSYKVDCLKNLKR